MRMRPQPTCRKREAIRIVPLLLVLMLLLASSRVHVVDGAFSDLPGRNECAVRVGVLGLFHPQKVIVNAPEGQAVVLRSGEQNIVLEHSGNQAATAQLQGSEILVTSGAQMIRASTVQVAGRKNQPVDFILEIPGKIIRPYHGALELKASADDLSAIVTLDLETAVASVVAAESAPDTPLEALKAHAVAARSYFVSGRGRHKEFDFCDTTHCQFLRTPPAASSRVAKAAAETRGLVLSYQGRHFAAMYTTVGNLIHETSPHVLIICEGLNYAADLADVARHPVRLERPGQVVYSMHDYSWFHPQGQSQQAYFEQMGRNGGYILSEQIAPLWIGEFGNDTRSLASFGLAPAPHGGQAASAVWWNNVQAWLIENDVDWCW